MGRSEKTIQIWVLIRRYDQLECQSTDIEELREVSISTNQTFDELKSLIFSWARVDDGTVPVLKIRKFDNTLVPISALLQGSTQEKPFLIDIVGEHQFCPVEKRTFPPGYIDALKSKLSIFEKRIETAETEIPDMPEVHARAIENAAAELSTCVRHLDKRLDELMPQHWKNQIEAKIL